MNVRLRELILVSLTALLGAFLIVRQVVRPTYTDSYYHFNAAVRLASGEGLTDEYIWTYVGQVKPALVVPSHLYWMPFTSIMTGMSMSFFNAPGNYAAAQIPLILMFAGTIVIGYILGYKLGGTRRHAVVAFALTLCSGFFTKFWGETDTFAAYAFIGSLCLLVLGYGMEQKDWRWFALAGVAAGFGHLTRSDGLLLLIAGLLAVILIPFPHRTRSSIVFIGTYFLVMGLWFVRMIEITGSPLPVGGMQAAWFTDYNDLFRFPPDSSAAEFFANGLNLFLETRWTAFVQNLQTFLFVEGFIVLMPLMVIGLWRKRSTFVLPMLLFTLGVHAAMTFVFPFPGWRGGLFHGVAALIPWWAVFAVVGLDAVVDWIAKRRRNWQPHTAKRIFSIAVVLLAAVLSYNNARGIRLSIVVPASYAALKEELPPDARVLINDPAQFYYFTGIGGAVLPNEAPEVIAQIASEYDITHVVLEDVRELDGREVSTSVPLPLQTIFANPPSFLSEMDLGIPGIKVYAIK